MSGYFVVPPLLGVIGLGVAFFIYHIMTRHDHGDGLVQKIGDQIHLGAMVFMHREYKMLGMFAAVLLVLIFVSPLGGKTALRALTARAAAGGFVSSTSSNVSIKVGWSWNQSFRESHQFDKMHAL